MPFASLPIQPALPSVFLPRVSPCPYPRAEMARTGRHSRGGGKGNGIGPTPALMAAACILCHTVKDRDEFSKSKWRERKCIDCVQGSRPQQQQHSRKSTTQERLNRPLWHSRSQQRIDSSQSGDLGQSNTLRSTLRGDGGSSQSGDLWQSSALRSTLRGDESGGGSSQSGDLGQSSALRSTLRGDESGGGSSQSGQQKRSKRVGTI